MEKLLRQLDLTKYEAKAYLALLKTDKVTAYKLGKLSGVPSGRIYDVVDSLVSKGLVEVLPGKPKLVKAIEPQVGLKSLLEKQNREWKRKYNQLNDLIEKLESKEEGEIVSLSKGEDLYYQNIVWIYGKAEEEILGILGGLTPPKKGVDLNTPAKMSIDRGVENKAIAPITEEKMEVAEDMKSVGIKMRDYPVEGLRMHVADGKYAMLTIVDDKNWKNRYIIKIRQESTARTLKKMFMRLWEEAEEF